MGCSQPLATDPRCHASPRSGADSAHGQLEGGASTAQRIWHAQMATARPALLTYFGTGSNRRATRPGTRTLRPTGISCNVCLLTPLFCLFRMVRIDRRQQCLLGRHLPPPCTPCHTCTTATGNGSGGSSGDSGGGGGANAADGGAAVAAVGTKCGQRDVFDSTSGR